MLFFENPVGTIARKSQLDEAGKDQGKGNEVGDRDLKLGYEDVGHHHRYGHNADNDHRNYRQNPGA